MMKTLLALLVILGVVACAIIAPPPQELVAKNDHAALAVWYEMEAANLRQKAREMEVMIEEYRKDRERGRRLMIHPPKADFVQECNNLAVMYTNAASQAEKLATSHREMTRSGQFERKAEVRGCLLSLDDGHLEAGNITEP